VRAIWFSGFELGSVGAGVTVVNRIFAYELVKRFCEIKQRELCILLCVGTCVLVVVSSELLCDFRMENHEYCITNHLIPVSRVFLENDRYPTTQEIPRHFMCTDALLQRL